MKLLDERLRGLARSFVAHNLSIMGQTDGGISLVLGTQELTGRLPVARATSSITNARAAAWATLSVTMHQQMKTVVDQVMLHYTEKFRDTYEAPNHLDLLETRFTEATMKEWLIAQQLLEGERIKKVLLMSTVFDGRPAQLLKVHNPYAPTNSSVSALTVTAVTHIANQTALAVGKQAGRSMYRLWTSGDQREPDIYKRLHEIGKGPVGPMFVGDRSLVVLT